MQGEIINELVLNFLGLGVSGKGPVALWLALPVSIVLVAIAWRIAIGKKP